MSPNLPIAILRRVHRTLNSVVLGITLMALIALYVALGSGFPRLREFFEMNELQFFNAWPLKSLMALLVVSLSVVTWTRIPLTPPRYGVWCIHAGIITLILGTGFYYHRKVEGLTRIPVGQSTDYFYDTGLRALYARAGVRLAVPWQLPSLPRFKSYTDETSGAFRGSDVHAFTPFFDSADPAATERKPESLAAELGVKDVKLDITGYWPYAELRTDYRDDPSSNDVGVSIRLAGVNGKIPANAHMAWLVATDPAARLLDLGGVELEHRPAVDENILKAAANLHRIDAKVGNFAQTLFVEIGKTYTLGDTGYSITAESYNPSFPMSGTGEMVQTMTLHVTSIAPATPREFRRMILGGKPLQTDFALNVAGAGPMGKRQKEPLDKDLTLLYTLNDPYQLLPAQGGSKHTLVTMGNDALIDISTGLNHASEISTFADGSGEITIHPGGEQDAPFAGGMAAAQNPPSHESIKLQVRRDNHVLRNEHVVEVPPAQRDRDTGQAGIYQILRVRVTSGSWSKDVYVPFSQYAAEEEWSGQSSSDDRNVAPSEPIMLPGATEPLTLRLGQDLIPLPARLTLERFDAVPYDGIGKSGSSLMRDFCSTLTVEDRGTGDKVTDVAHMNHPVYFGSGSWLFFQAQWDPQGQRWTVLGVGNRPGVGIMVAGCVMIVVGLLYAFYAKPLIIARMKRNALAKAGVKSAIVDLKPRDRTPTGAGV